MRHVPCFSSILFGSGKAILGANDQLICLVVGPEGGEVPQLLQHRGGLHRDRLRQADSRHEAQPGEPKDMQKYR
jgi:hypothetical protein